jgi:GLPGLI family protein
MKYILFTLLFLFNIPFSFGQEEKLYSRIFTKAAREISDFVVKDTGHIKVWYTLNAVGKINKIDSCDDLQVLEIGNNISKYYSYFVFRNDSVTEIANKKKAGSSSFERGSSQGMPSWSEYFKDFKSGIFTEYARMPLNIADCYYSEDIPVQNWKLFDDTLRVAGYLCQRAECSFSGRNYVAWFTPDIPVSNGPWKLGGLPGLILKVSDTDEKFVFESIGIETKNVFSIKAYNIRDYTKSNKSRVLQLLKKIDENYFVLVGTRVQSGDLNSRMGKTTRKPKFNTMLLELE